MGKRTARDSKKKMTDLPDPLIQNSGKEMSEFDKYQGLADVTFSIYNVTSEFYEQRAAGASVDAAKQAVQSLTPGKPVAQGTTDANGNVTVQLPKNKMVKMQCIPLKKNQRGCSCCYEYGGGVPSLRNDQASRWFL